MTRKHFVAISGVLRINGADEAICLEFADLLARENKLFDYNRFMSACGHPSFN